MAIRQMIVNTTSKCSCCNECCKAILIPKNVAILVAPNVFIKASVDLTKTKALPCGGCQLTIEFNDAILANPLNPITGCDFEVIKCEDDGDVYADLIAGDVDCDKALDCINVNPLTITGDGTVASPFSAVADVVTNVTSQPSGNVIGTYTNEAGTPQPIRETITNVASNVSGFSYTNEIGAVQNVTFPVQVPETVFTGVKGNGIDITAGGLNGHTPTIALNLNPTTNTTGDCTGNIGGNFMVSNALLGFNAGQLQLTLNSKPEHTCDRQFIQIADTIDVGTVFTTFGNFAEEHHTLIRNNLSCRDKRFMPMLSMRWSYEESVGTYNNRTIGAAYNAPVSSFTGMWAEGDRNVHSDTKLNTLEQSIPLLPTTIAAGGTIVLNYASRYEYSPFVAATIRFIIYNKVSTLFFWEDTI